jgi:hypothetical protein
VTSQLPLIVPAALTLLLVGLTSESRILSAVHAVLEHAVYLLD